MGVHPGYLVRHHSGNSVAFRDPLQDKTTPPNLKVDGAIPITGYLSNESLDLSSCCPLPHDLRRSTNLPDAGCHAHESNGGAERSPSSWRRVRDETRAIEARHDGLEIWGPA